MTFSALDSALVGPLFATAAMREIFSDRAWLAAMLDAEAALAEVEAIAGLVPETLAPAIRAIDPASLDLAQLGAETALAGVPTIPFIKAVQARLPPELERAFHKGATTQDILDTALVLQMREGFRLLADDLDPVLAGLGRLAAEHRLTRCVGRSYGQQAQPLSFGFKVAVWAAGIAEVAAERPHLRERVLRASLGGPVGTLSGLGHEGPAIADAYADALGLGRAPIAWHVRRAGIVAAASWLATLIGALAKMATDVAALASTEVGEVAEPFVPGRGASSAMPHKRNPVSATVIVAAHTAAAGHVGTLIAAMAAPHERPAGLWHTEWHALPSLFGLASGALAEARRLAEGLVVNRDRMAQNLDLTRGLLFADAVASRLAGLVGRGRAHDIVEHAATRVREGGGSLRDEIEAEPAVSGLLAPAELDRAFDPAPAVEAAAAWVDRVLETLPAARAALNAPET